MAQETAATIIQRASAEVGIPVSNTPFASSDPSQKLMIQLLSGSGTELAAYFEWPVLDKSWTIDTDIDGTTGQYSLPSDFGWAHNGTFYNVTAMRPVEGPKTATEWNSLIKSFIGGNVYGEAFRQFGTYIQITPTPLAASTTYTLEYTSSRWVRSSGGSYKSSVTEADDVVLLDAHVVSRLLKLRYLEAKQMNTATASAEFKSALNDATFVQAGAPKLRINGAPAFIGINSAQVGDTGYGS